MTHADFNGEKNPNYKNAKKEFHCSQCKMRFFKYPCIFNGKEKHIYCSRLCYKIWKKENYKPEDNPLYKLGGHSDKTKELQSKIAIERMLNPFYQKRYIRALKVKPNKPERFLIDLFQKNNIPLTYVGDGKEFINRFNPDFINLNKRVIVEFFGDYWHDKDFMRIRDCNRIISYSDNGFITLILRKDDLSNPINLLNRVKSFIGE